MRQSHPILSRLDTGRPLLLGGEPAASLIMRGVRLQGPAALGRLVREDPVAVREHYHLEIASGVDVLCALTAETIPRALQQIGMPFQSAALTGAAVELAQNAAELTPRPVIVAGVLGTSEVQPMDEDRIAEELGAHATRLAAAGCEVILARGFGLPPGSSDSARTDARFSCRARRVAITCGTITGLPTWAVIALGDDGEATDGSPADECAREAFGAGAQVVVFDVSSPAVARSCMDSVGGLGPIGFALAGKLRPNRMGDGSEGAARCRGKGPGGRTWDDPPPRDRPLDPSSWQRAGNRSGRVPYKSTGQRGLASTSSYLPVPRRDCAARP